MNKEISKPTHPTIKIYSQRCLQSCVLYEITEDEVSGSIDCIKVHSSQGFDQIPAKFLKLSKCVLAPILAKLNLINALNKKHFLTNSKYPVLFLFQKLLHRSLLEIFVQFHYSRFLVKYLKKFWKVELGISYKNTIFYLILNMDLQEIVQLNWLLLNFMIYYSPT